MNTMFRTLIVLADCALTSALFGASVNLGYLDSSNVIDVTVEGSFDGSFAVYDTDTNQEVAYVSFYKNFYGGSSWWYSDFFSAGGSYVSGVNVSAGGQSASVTGLPSGSYRIEYYANSYPCSDSGSGTVGGWSAPTVHFEPVYYTGNWDWLDFYTSVY